MLDYIKEILPAIIGSVIVIASVEMYQSVVFTYNVSMMDALLSSVLIGIVVYAASMRLFFNYLLNDVKLLIREMRG